ncbi:hypothetical protein ABKN59_002357 [Abortiporus biennis]
MDSLDIRFEEIVADSEDEDSMLPNRPNMGHNGVTADSSIQTAEFTSKNPSKNTSDISSFTNKGVPNPLAASSFTTNGPGLPFDSVRQRSTNGSSSIQSATANPVKGKVRPRPAWKNSKAGQPSSGSSANDTSSISTDPFAQSTSTSATSLSIQNGNNTHLPSTDYDSIYGGSMYDRAKTRSRKKSTAESTKSKAAPQQAEEGDVIEITSSDEDDELLLGAKPSKSNATSKQKDTSNTRPKPMSKAKAKAPQVVPQSPTPPSLPAPTSDFPIPIAAVESSQLPPSDPPVPSTASSMPPGLAIPPEFSPPTSFIGNMKRRRILSDDEDDARDGTSLTKSKSKTKGQMLPPPVPTSIIPSSSVVIPETQVQTGSSRAPAIPGTGIIDFTQDPSTFAGDTDIDMPLPPAPKPRKRKAQDSHFDGGDGSGSEWGEKPKKAVKKVPAKKKKVINDDDEGSEWDGDDASKKTKKAKGKPKPKAKGKEKEKTQEKSKPKGKGKARVEVVIEVPSKTSPVKQTGRVTAEAANDPSRLESELSSLSDDELAGPIDVEPDKGATASSSKSLPTSNTKSSGKAASVPKTTKAKAKRRGVIESDDDEPKDLEASPPAKKRAKTTAASKSKGKQRATEDEVEIGEKTALARERSLKENGDPTPPPTPHSSNPNPDRSSSQPPPGPPTSSAGQSASSFTSASASRTTPMMHRARSTIPNLKSTPMSELIRKVNSQPGSPFISNKPTYSPYMKSSKSLLRKIAPLHPNRRTPPPPPPRVVVKEKKSKKMLELEEKWEMELEETIDGWYCMSEEERASLRRAKRDKEFGLED